MSGLRKKPQDSLEAFEQLHEAGLDLLFAIGDALGIVWLVKRTPFLKLRPWAAERDSRRNQS